MTRPLRTDGVLLAAECTDVPRCLADTRRVWVIRLGELAHPLAGLGAAKEKALREDYRSEQVWRPGGLTVALFVLAPRGR